MYDSLDQNIQNFFSSRAYAVVGASSNREKFGNKVLRAYLQKHKKVYPINPNEKIIEGVPCLPNLQPLPDEVQSISIITPPFVTENIVQQAILKGIKHIWMQPGAESDLAIKLAEDKGINVIARGPCILVILRFSESTLW